MCSLAGWQGACTVHWASSSSASTWSAPFSGTEAAAGGWGSELGIWSWFEFWSTTYSSSLMQSYWPPCCCSWHDTLASPAPTWWARCANVSCCDPKMQKSSYYHPQCFFMIVQANSVLCIWAGDHRVPHSSARSSSDLLVCQQSLLQPDSPRPVPEPPRGVVRLWLVQRLWPGNQPVTWASVFISR